MKKILALILVVLMFVTAMPLQSFALTLKPLKITGVEFANDNPISMKYVAANSWNGTASLYSYDNLYLNYNEKFYDFYVYFSDGDKVLFSEIFDEKEEISSYSGPDVIVSYDECYTAILNEEETVNVTITLNLRTDRRNLPEYTCTLQKKIVPYIVKNMKPVAALPDKVYRDMDGAEAFGDVQFEVEYYGGKKEILNCGYDEGMVVPPDNYYSGSFEYIDGYYHYEYEELDPLYTAVKIDDCKFADSHLKEVSFTLTKNDGTTEQYTKTMDIGVYDDVDLGKINGYNIDISFGNSVPTFTSDDEFDVDIYVGGNYDEVTFEPEEVCECEICHYKGLRYIRFCILDFIWKLFGKNQYCSCGSENWYTMR